MPLGDDTYYYRQRLPHLQREYKTYFVTFCTKWRRELTSGERDIVLRECVSIHSEPSGSEEYRWLWIQRRPAEAGRYT